METTLRITDFFILNTEHLKSYPYKMLIIQSGREDEGVVPQGSQIIIQCYKLIISIYVGT